MLPSLLLSPLFFFFCFGNDTDFILLRIYFLTVPAAISPSLGALATMLATNRIAHNARPLLMPAMMPPRVDREPSLPVARGTSMTQKQMKATSRMTSTQKTRMGDPEPINPVLECPSMTDQ
jgi:hypothetical protein